MDNPLLVVDVQRAFINPFTHHVPARIARLIERGDYHPVVFTRFVNAAGSPYQRFLDWHDCATPDETAIVDELSPFLSADNVFVKTGTAGLSPELTAYLQDRGDERITLAGIDTDMCVLKVAMDVFDLGIRPVILVDCCASTAGLQSHLAGLAILARNIGAGQLREAGLSDGLLGAPPQR